MEYCKQYGVPTIIFVKGQIIQRLGHTVKGARDRQDNNGTEIPGKKIKTSGKMQEKWFGVEK